MIVEQIRYYLTPDVRETVLELRRRIAMIRQDSGLPTGKLLLADEDEEESPQIVWQCGYEDEAALGHAETQLIGNTGYEEARAQLGALGVRVILELYTLDEAD
jgi:hypothetical protein